MHSVSRDLWLETALYTDSLEGPQLKSYFTSKYIESKITQAHLTYHKNCQLANGDKPKRLSTLSRKWSAHHSLGSALGSHLPILTACMKKGAGKEQDFRICRCFLGKSICWLKTVSSYLPICAEGVHTLVVPSSVLHIIPHSKTEAGPLLQCIISALVIHKQMLLA